MIYFLGDIHFSCNRPWRLPLGHVFLDWFEHDFIRNSISSQEHDLIALGDYVDSAVNGGEVIDQLYRFISLCSKYFRTVYLLQGNHDIAHLKDLPQTAFKFARQFRNIKILVDPFEILTVQGVKILSMPHLVSTKDIPSMIDYYNNPPETIVKQTYDVLIGHFTDSTCPDFGSAKTIDLSSFQTRKIILGHIHLRVSDHYIGSVYPCKISEDNDDYPSRAIFCLDPDTFSITEIPIPQFIKFRTVSYPESLTPGQEKITVWTVKNCDLDHIAKNYYYKENNWNTFVRGVEADFVKKNAAKIDTISTLSFLGENKLEVFESWMKESKTVLNRNVVKIIKNLLSS